MKNAKSPLWTKYLSKKYEDGAHPIRAELFSQEQMEKYGKTLAKSHIISNKTENQQKLLSRLDENESILLEVYNLVTESVKLKKPITPAGEWLLDNFYLIEEQIRIGRKHLPKGYSKELPCLVEGNSIVLPRVYEMAKEIIAHGDGRIDPESLRKFIISYQDVKTLKLGELWAIPIMLRLALIENLRRVAGRIAVGIIHRDLADSWADQMIETAEKNPKNLILIIADMARSSPPISTPFVSEFVKRLQGQSTALAFPLTWIEQRLAESNQTIIQFIQYGNQKQAADQLSISNGIGSLRLLSSMDWRDFVESISQVEQILHQDPAEIYTSMDFFTRDHYRHVVEKIAKRSILSEVDIANKIIELAQEGAKKNGIKDRTAHVGFYLVARGRKDLESFAQINHSLISNIRKIVFNFPLFFYIGSILLLTLFFSFLLILKASNDGINNNFLWVMGIIFIVGTSYLSVSIINWLATIFVVPYSLPRLDYSKGISNESKTLVVIPSMLLSKQNIESLVEDLEVRFLANKDENLYFGLLTDFKDSKIENLEDDNELIELVSKKINELNEKYPREQDSTFFLFHRPRKWNNKDKLWMGYERKRGKLSDLNSLILNENQTAFSVVIATKKSLKKIKYVITLDSDTQLPKDSARQLVGAMSHPLNKPKFDPIKQRVTEGYTILQPRVAISLPSTNRSMYAKLFGSEAGIDPYTKAISDVYQDLFGEGSFIGKGIYEVETFEKTLKDRFPENRILSHDLLEGCYARSGLLSDVLLFEEYPENYLTDIKRKARWIRGDWQLLPWLGLFVPKLNGSVQKNPLSPLSLWKIFDNIRRSLVPMALTLILLLGWTILGAPWFWTLVVTIIILTHSLIISIIHIFQKPEEIFFKQHLKYSIKSASMHFYQAMFILITLPYESFYTSKAILQTLWRVVFSQKKLLEWNTSFKETTNSNHIINYFSNIWFSTFMAIISTGFLLVFFPKTLVMIVPIIFLWAVFPIIAWWLSEPLVPHVAKLTDKQYVFLRALSRKTWFFFETFVGKEDNWLPPDNYQEDPISVIAHRTSPTNMGLSLLANLSAYDFGYITASELIERTSNTFKTMHSMEQYKGHFFNWYNTQSLEPLRPVYISSVDSGNLAGHLLTLKQGLFSLTEQKIIDFCVLEGISDTLQIILNLLGKSVTAKILQFQKILALALHEKTIKLSIMKNHLNELSSFSNEISNSFASDMNEDLKIWTNKLHTQCKKALDEIDFFAPWLQLDFSLEIANKFLEFDSIPTLKVLSNININDLSSSEYLISIDNNNEKTKLNDKFILLLKKGIDNALERIEIIDSLVLQTDNFAKMEYDFLYDKSRHLQSVGYNVEEKKRDSSYYDLLASEARLSSFVAIAQDQLPQESWFALGRLLTTIDGEPILLSWSGSMFEYLMPLIVMPSYENTLLFQSCRTSVIRQIEYGKLRSIPWGISESAYNTVDAHLNYQYHAFGVPGLGLKRGLSEDLVITPYATALSLMVMPEEACANLEKMANEGFMGKFGFYEAIDYTPARVPRGKNKVVIKSFMAHHQGMTFLSLAYILLDKPMQKRFESAPLFQANLFLLHEKIPKATKFFSHTSGIANLITNTTDQDIYTRFFDTPNTPFPEVNLLSNGGGQYRTVITNAGGGYSQWKDMALTRWREDSTCDNWGSFCYIRDVETGDFWSNTYQPTLKKSNKYEAIFSEGRAEFRRNDFNIDTHTEIVVSPEDDIELKRIVLTNKSKFKRTIDITSYAEVVLSPNGDDLAHPAFSKLFVQTEIIPTKKAILCTRRPRSIQENPPWMFHLMIVRGAEVKKITYETDRMKFIGRGNTLVEPQAMTKLKELSGSQGSVLDPIVSIQYQIVLEAEASATIDIVTGASESAKIALNLVEKYQDRHFANRVFELTWTHSQVVLRQINASEGDAQIYSRLASAIIFPNYLLRAESEIIVKNRRGQSGLWGYSISGDLPIVLLKIEDINNINIVRQLVQAHAYWRLKGLAVDLVIWNEDHIGYRQLLQEQIIGLIASGIEANIIDRPGGIYVRSSDQISNEDRILFHTVACIIISDTKGSLIDQINKHAFNDLYVPPFKATRNYKLKVKSENVLTRKDLIFYNGLGGFTPDGREYVITTSKDKVTPLPWSNVIANSTFGTVISENGLSYTWGENAHEYRITPWNNDPVTDSSGEAIYIRDEETGHVWSPTPLTDSESKIYISRHGFGYSVFEHNENGIYTELWVYVALDASIKFSVLKIKNNSNSSYKLSVTSYVEWVLGDLRSRSSMHINTNFDVKTNAIYASNPYNSDNSKRVSFIQTNETISSITCDRTEFLGRNGNLKNPAAMKRAKLSGKNGVALDPCGAIQVSFDLAMGQEKEVVFKLGTGKDLHEANQIVERFSTSISSAKALEEVWKYWSETLNSVRIETPNLEVNLLANGWLLYQTLACRIWARSGYYQSGGAFGFRDQLQDVMALVHSRPELLRKHLLLCASRQFIEGDVQHWWHPPTGKGVRTHCSDDYLWLPLATTRYVISSGDTGVLNELSFFIEDHAVNIEDDSYYNHPRQSEEKGTLYEHCKRAITHGLKFGSHGLPLIGTCDWNDGMNMVGNKGKGESVWLGFFLFEVLTKFIKLAEIQNDLEFANLCKNQAEKIRQNIEKNGWDGEWYRRAYFDDGSALGSESNEECKIDSISQSWSILSNAGSSKRSKIAMESLNNRLINREYSIVQLLDPPFDKSDLNPGYIKGYVPGVRENGGQYTHAAIWAAMAFSEIGDGVKAWEILKMINPINHTQSPEEVEKYKVEPYVIAADVYARSPHTGRGGWTWYTGSAGWMYRLILESLLGLRLEVDKLYIEPCIPSEWKSFTIDYKYRETLYKITINQINEGIDEVIVDGLFSHNVINLVDDHLVHNVEVKISKKMLTL